jgi:hypothetical protein
MYRSVFGTRLVPIVTKLNKGEATCSFVVGEFFLHTL